MFIKAARQSAKVTSLNPFPCLNFWVSGTVDGHCKLSGNFSELFALSCVSYDFIVRVRNLYSDMIMRSVRVRRQQRWCHICRVSYRARLWLVRFSQLVAENNSLLRVWMILSILTLSINQSLKIRYCSVYIQKTFSLYFQINNTNVERLAGRLAHLVLEALNYLDKISLFELSFTGSICWRDKALIPLTYFTWLPAPIP